MSKQTQSDRVLAYLSGHWWVSGLTFVRMRKPILSYTKIIALLRKQGHKIEGKQVGHIHYYKLAKS